MTASDSSSGRSCRRDNSEAFLGLAFNTVFCGIDPEHSVHGKKSEGSGGLSLTVHPALVWGIHARSPI
jgi:hypothetical protein